MLAPLALAADYSYDRADRLIQAAMGGYTTTIAYDLAGRKTAMNDADMGAWVYAYNALGELIRQTDAKGQRVCLYYDGLGRLLGRHYRADTTARAARRTT